MTSAERTSATGLEAHIRGVRLAASDDVSAKDVLVQIFTRERAEPSLVVPAVAEPLIVWVLSGEAAIEEREPGEDWVASAVRQGDFFLTTSAVPYEMRWQVTSAAPFVVMHVYLGLQLLERAIEETDQGVPDAIRLREVSGGRDEALSLLLEQFRLELTTSAQTSPLLMQGIAQCLAVHLARHYRDDNAENIALRNALPAYKLRRVVSVMENTLDEEFRLSELAHEIGLSEYHFSRLFKRATGHSPSQYFIKLRMTRAKQLLAETDRSIIDIGMDVGYSSASHFSQVFKREVGVTPSHYRRP
ncbi:helix-turn-helix domain-containing protein [Pseudomonas sp. 14P_8.1_Bac3]|uniref:helix-turn-helix domain-containing protein n=1 Tax=Pseudomonas sp. 14P_8.1_Bac3 TaxID=2971621 RepID=UPI0021C88257|nr:helix-turn-helix domain-containing protein [Pseudomonas sp. 14P_8.1_Bac3]MCU1759794.1 helix-turn-helix domain-containing protein [Pseudomonas sp. 14P_8.1_Bac3]